MITAMAPAAAAVAGVSPTGSAATIPVRIVRPIIPARRAIPAAAGEATAGEAAAVIDVTELARETCDCACETRLFRLVPN